MSKKTITVKICCGMNCLTHGGQELLESMVNNHTFTKYFVFESVGCRDSCGEGGYRSPVVEIEGKIYCGVTPEFLTDKLTCLMRGDDCPDLE